MRTHHGNRMRHLTPDIGFTVKLVRMLTAVKAQCVTMKFLNTAHKAADASMAGINSRL